LSIFGSFLLLLQVVMWIYSIIYLSLLEIYRILSLNLYLSLMSSLIILSVLNPDKEYIHHYIHLILISHSRIGIVIYWYILFILSHDCSYLIVMNLLNLPRLCYFECKLVIDSIVQYTYINQNNTIFIRVCDREDLSWFYFYPYFLLLSPFSNTFKHS
jgi:hypothetical protein